ncbi:sugar phosphate isomerase/epimerase family protein [Bryobacter aggregatus]|uniref:sugar phosphate isomerase/epimerase family protein n=1 Tax=Bryobacter aggregatus TaxID=360054 RepID=UPI0004E1214F|nr:sugar phosphate isomerase/epimerase family protein [Bryobacter aggregatus]
MTNRRSFLASSTAGAGFALAAPPASNPNIHELNLGVASYSLREFQRSLAIKTLKQLNVTYVNIKEFHLPYILPPAEVEKGRKQFEAAGLKILGGGTISFQKDEEPEIRSSFEYCKNAGMPLMVAMPTRAILPKLEKYAKEYNIKVAVHNHGPEDKNFPSIQDVLPLVKNMDPRMGVCLDIGHESRAGKNILESIDMAGPRLLDMHVKDLKDTMVRESQCDVGDGKLPIVAIFKLLQKMKYAGGVMLEYEINADNPTAGLAKSLAYCRGVLAGLSA